MLFGRIFKFYFKFFSVFFTFCFPLYAQELENVFQEKVVYDFSNEPIDVVIPCSVKDKDLLDLCIKGIRENGKNINRIIVVSEKLFTNEAEWFDEKNYPFSKEDLIYEIFKKDESGAKRFASNSYNHIGWIYQQFLKLYAMFIIPNISSNVLILDADTIFLAPTEFMNENSEPLFNPGTEYHMPYFNHAKRLLPGFQRVYKEYSGISHHMLFQRSILEDLFNEIYQIHKKEPWKALCNCIDTKEVFGSCLSEYEIYFNFTFLKTNQGKIRLVKWTNINSIQKIQDFKKNNYVYVSCHSWMRQK
jgi:hypothetical protein